MLSTALKLLVGKGSVRSYSQFGEDAIIQALFKKQKKGIYVDVGAYHPILYSNTYALYRKGWHGWVVDPNGAMKSLYRVFRPRDTFVHSGVGEAGIKDYFEYKDPAYNSFVGAPNMKPVRVSKVALKPLKAIVAEHHITHIDFMNVDVEGMDTEVLASHDWGIKPAVIAVESPLGGPAQSFLEAKGYKLVGKAGATLIFKV